MGNLIVLSFGEIWAHYLFVQVKQTEAGDKRTRKEEEYQARRMARRKYAATNRGRGTIDTRMKH